VRALLFYIALIFSIALNAQTKEELQRQKVLLQDQIDLANTLLKKTQNNRDASITELQTLNQKIESREKLIVNMSRQIRGIDREVAVKEREIKTLEIRIDSLKSRKK
jgi:chromosome segregation ATPase